MARWAGRPISWIRPTGPALITQHLVGKPWKLRPDTQSAFPRADPGRNTRQSWRAVTSLLEGGTVCAKCGDHSMAAAEAWTRGPRFSPATASGFDNSVAFSSRKRWRGGWCHDLILVYGREPYVLCAPSLQALPASAEK